MPRDLFRLTYAVEMKAPGSNEAEVTLGGEIIRDMPDAWKWSKEDKSAANFDKAIKDVRANGATKLLLRINSPGGIVTEAVAMRAILASAGFEEINIRIEGMCASSATIISTLPGAHVTVAEGSLFMIHNPTGGIRGNASEIESYAQSLRKIEKNTRDFYTARSNQSEDQIKQWMDSTTWFSADETVQYGFADDVLKAEDSDTLPAVACVTEDDMALMRSLYGDLPDSIAVRDSAQQNNPVSNAEPVAGEASENKNHEEEHDTMDIKDINMDQLRADNPALLEQIRKDAVDAERQRIEDIDNLTMDGYEAMAEEAKRNGTSALDFQRQVAKAQREAKEAQRQKGEDYMKARKKDTEDAKQVAGGASEDNDGKTEEEEIKALQDDVKGYAASMKSGNETMY
ncbi:MAG: ATP-dependent Clp protease proteolytic subunit [Clostridia bacterium]|nr:ATP-dependent Clp protease proteolytic subunit [Clostridia bacterium]